jgi:hypothetical protein
MITTLQFESRRVRLLPLEPHVLQQCAHTGYSLSCCMLMIKLAHKYMYTMHKFFGVFRILQLVGKSICILTPVLPRVAVGADDCSAANVSPAAAARF